MSFPTTLDTFTTPVAGQPLNSPSLTGIVNAQQTALTAVEAKVGIDSSAVTTTLDYKLKNTASVDPGHKHTTAALSGAIAIANGGTGQTAKTAAFDALSPNTTKGDITVYNGTTSVRQPVGTNNYVLTADSAQATGVKFADPNTIITPFPTASIVMYSGAAAPTSWFLCDGAAVSRTTYSALFAIISTTYGAGDGATTFNVPDMRGRVPVGVGTGTGGGATGTGLPTGGSALTAVARGTWKGEETHLLTTAELASHTHQMFANGGGSVGGSGTASGSAGGGVVNTGAAGSDTAHNNIQPIMGINFIIKQ